ncbi:MAG: hypothetical protein MJ152_00275, partial [Clostridia bacterium]|nr:hypothetical protein [Clostridia bacterium]
KRLNEMMQQDRQTNPQCLLEVIKFDFFYLINYYFEVDYEDIKININLVADKYKIDVEAAGDRLKIMKTLP